MFYIDSIASISHQNSFRTENLYANLQTLTSETEPEKVDYKEFVPPAALRRLSPVLRMALTAAIECQNSVEQEFDSISVGTALGCLRDTEKFLVTFHTTTSDVLSPTAFIQSTHNTIGGQISLGLKNHAYNMTHTQNSLSFEVALLDGMLCIKDGRKSVLVGAADEKIPFLELVQPSLIPEGYPLTTGASFMVLTPNEKAIAIPKVHVSFNCQDVDLEIAEFLDAQNLKTSDLDLVLYSDQLPDILSSAKDTMNYLDYSGMHYSAPAFATHIAHDFLKSTTNKRALVVNTMCQNRLGLTLVERQ